MASYTVSLLNPKVIDDLELHRHGLRIVERQVNNFWPTPEGDFLAFETETTATKAEIARFSPADAANLDRYYRDIETVANLIRDLLLKPPPNVGGGIKELLSAARLGNRFRKLSIEEDRVVLDIFTKSVDDFLSLYFEHPYVKAAFAFDGVVGNYASPYAPGTAYVLMHHAFGEVNGKSGVWGHAIGGMGAITQAMANSALEHGVQIELNCPVDQIIVNNNRATGVVTASGHHYQGKVIAVNANPKVLYQDLLDPALLPADFRRRMQHYKIGSGTFRMNVALDRLPQFTCLQRADRGGDHYLSSGIVIGPTIDYLERAYTDARQQGFSRQPIVEMLIPSTLDDSLAPPGKHVASLFCQHFDPDVDWASHRAAATETILDTVERHAPGFKAGIVGKQVLSPLDLEQKLALTRGGIMHGNLSLDQMFSARPILGYGDYRAPIDRLYMCGAGTHPGGGVTGAPGHNAAAAIVRDGLWRQNP